MVVLPSGKFLFEGLLEQAFAVSAQYVRVFLLQQPSSFVEFVRAVSREKVFHRPVEYFAFEAVVQLIAHFGRFAQAEQVLKIESEGALQESGHGAERDSAPVVALVQDSSYGLQQGLALWNTQAARLVLGVKEAEAGLRCKRFFLPRHRFIRLCRKSPLDSSFFGWHWGVDGVPLEEVVRQLVFQLQ